MWHENGQYVPNDNKPAVITKDGPEAYWNRRPKIGPLLGPNEVPIRLDIRHESSSDQSVH